MHRVEGGIQFTNVELDLLRKNVRIICQMYRGIAYAYRLNLESIVSDAGFTLREFEDLSTMRGCAAAEVNDLVRALRTFPIAYCKQMQVYAEGESDEAHGFLKELDALQKEEAEGKVIPLTLVRNDAG